MEILKKTEKVLINFYDIIKLIKKWHTKFSSDLAIVKKSIHKLNFKQIFNT